MMQGATRRHRLPWRGPHRRRAGHHAGLWAAAWAPTGASRRMWARWGGSGTAPSSGCTVPRLRASGTQDHPLERAKRGRPAKDDSVRKSNEVNYVDLVSPEEPKIPSDVINVELVSPEELKIPRGRPAGRDDSVTKSNPVTYVDLVSPEEPKISRGFPRRRYINLAELEQICKDLSCKFDSEEEQRTKVGTTMAYPVLLNSDDQVLLKCNEQVWLNCKDLKCLEPGGLIRSSIFELYTLYLEGKLPLKPTVGSKIRGKYHILNTFFYKKIVDAKGDAHLLKRLLRWLKHVKKDEMTYLFIPVNGECHWSLAIIVLRSGNEGVTILHLDSLKNMHTSSVVFTNIQRFLDAALDIKHNVVTISLEVPQQGNLKDCGVDCGVYALYNIQRFIVDAGDKFPLDKFDKINKHWYGANDISALRENIKSLIHTNKLIPNVKCGGCRNEREHDDYMRSWGSAFES